MKHFAFTPKSPRPAAAVRARPRTHTLPRFVARVGDNDVQSLLDRDRAAAGVAADAVADETAFDDADVAAAEAAAASDEPGLKQKQQEPKPAKARSAAAASSHRTCREALDAGEKLLRQGDATAALAAFEAALDLPGSAAVRAAGSVVETSCPSDAEEAAALYNAACAYVALGQLDAADTMLRAALATDAPPDAATVLGDADLAPLGQ